MLNSGHQVLEMRKLDEAVPSYSQSLMKAGGPPDYSWKYKLEKESLLEPKFFLEKEMNAEVEIIDDQFLI